MSYEDSYYILMEPLSENYPNLAPAKKTASRNFDFKPLPMHGEPLFFENSELIDNPVKKNNYTVHPILMAGLSFVVTNEIKRYLSKLKLKGMHFYPAVYIENKDIWHENYWFLNIYSSLDCWDKKNLNLNQFLATLQALLRFTGIYWMLPY